MAGSDPDRILLALDACSELSADTASTVATLAARLGAAVEGLFVEDADLIRAAGLPFMTEVLAAGYQRALTLQGLRQMNRDVSARLERLMVEAARVRNVGVRYRSIEGSRLLVAFEAAQHCDLFMPRRAPRGRPPAAPAPAGGGRFRRVGVIAAEPGQAARALAVVQALARNGHTREVVLVSDAPPPPALLAQLAAERLRTVVRVLPLSDPGEVLNAVRLHGADLLVAPKHLLLAPGGEQDATALEALPLALMLLR